jgi:hypothetical protein
MYTYIIDIYVYMGNVCPPTLGVNRGVDSISIHKFELFLCISPTFPWASILDIFHCRDVRRTIIVRSNLDCIFAVTPIHSGFQRLLDKSLKTHLESE